MIRKKRHVLAAVLAVGALALTACSATGTEDDSAVVAQEISVAGFYPVVSLDPYGQYAVDIGTAFVAKQIYDTLFVTDGNGGYLPHLATEWTATDEGRTWTFTLREAQFSDGTEFTSADVKASIDALVASAGTLAKTWEAIEVATPDDRTVSLTSEVPGSSILTFVPQLRVGPADQIANDGFFNKPVGLGPYMVESFSSNQDVELVKNPNYWGEEATLDKVTIRTITDISARVTALLNNEVQAAWGIPDDQFGQLVDSDSLETKVQPSYSQFTMWMNAKEPGLDDYKVREAIWKAIDFDSIQKALYPFSATLATAPVSQAVTGAGSFEPYTYDPEAAKKLLAEAGYADGLTVNLQYSSANPFSDLIAAMKSDLDKVGVTVEVNAKEQPVWLEDLLALNFGINVQTVAAATGDATSNLSRLYKCSANRTGFCSDELDALIAEGDAAVDPAERAAAFLKVQEIIWDNAIGMFPLDVATTYAWSDTLSGFNPDPNFSPDLSQVKVVSSK